MADSLLPCGSFAAQPSKDASPVKGTFMSPRGPQHARSTSRTFSRTLFAGGRLMNSLGLSPKSAACRLLVAAGALTALAPGADAATPKHKYTFNQGNAN